MRCSYCGQKGASKQLEDQWYHQDCFEKMPANNIFPPEFRRRTALQTFLDEMRHYIKDGKFTGERK